MCLNVPWDLERASNLKQAAVMPNLKPVAISQPQASCSRSTSRRVASHFAGKQLVSALQQHAFGILGVPKKIIGLRLRQPLTCCMGGLMTSGHPGCVGLMEGLMQSECRLEGVLCRTSRPLRKDLRVFWHPVLRVSGSENPTLNLTARIRPVAGSTLIHGSE